MLDAFADRIGDNTWQTVITEDGLLAVKTIKKNGHEEYRGELSLDTGSA